MIIQSVFNPAVFDDYVPYIGAINGLDLGDFDFVTNGSISDGVLVLSDGSITGGVNATFTGQIQADNFVSSVTTGTQPYACTSTTLNINLNADLLDGQHASEFQAAGDYQPLDADLTAIAALGFASTSFLKKTAADTWALDTNTYLTDIVNDASPQLGADLDGQSLYDLTNIVDAEFEGVIGVGTTPNASYIINAVKSVSSAAAIAGLFGGVTNTRYSGIGNIGAVYGINFSANVKTGDLIKSGGISCAILQSAYCQLTVTTQANEDDNLTITKAIGYGFGTSPAPTFTRGAGSTGALTLTAFNQFETANPSCVNGATITTLCGFYDAGLTAGGTNYGFYGKTANNLLEDNCKWLFGTSSDLQIYHNGSNSYIYNDTGILKIQDAGSGINLGTATTELLGFYGVTPVDQPATVTDPTDLPTCITAISAIIDRLQELGLVA
jgi:hypothetical protein